MSSLTANTPIAISVKDQWFRAVLDHDLAGMQAALANGADINYTKADGKTALHYAVARGDGEMLRFLLMQDDLDLNAQTEQGYTPFLVAFKYGNMDAAHLLERFGVDTTIRTQKGEGPLYLTACSEKKTDHAQFAYALHHDENIDFFDANGSTALMRFVRMGKLLEALDLLLAGADIKAGGISGKKMREIALDSGMGVLKDILSAFAELPRLPDDISNLKGSDLLETDSNNRSMLDNPMTWRRMPEVLAHLQAKGEPLPSKDRLLSQSGVADLNMVPTSPAYIALKVGQWPAVTEMLKAQGEEITGADLADESGKRLTGFGRQMCHNGLMKAMFDPQLWKGQSPAKLHHHFRELPLEAQEQVPNFQQLALMLRRDARAKQQQPER